MKNSNFRSPFTSKRVPFLQFLGPLVIVEQCIPFPPSFPSLSIDGSNWFPFYWCLTQEYWPGQCPHRRMQRRGFGEVCNPRSNQSCPSAAQAAVKLSSLEWCSLHWTHLELGKDGGHRGARTGPCSVHLNKSEPTLWCANPFNRSCFLGNCHLHHHRLTFCINTCSSKRSSQSLWLATTFTSLFGPLRPIVASSSWSLIFHSHCLGLLLFSFSWTRGFLCDLLTKLPPWPIVFLTQLGVALSVMSTKVFAIKHLMSHHCTGSSYLH